MRNKKTKIEIEIARKNLYKKMHRYKILCDLMAKDRLYKINEANDNIKNDNRVVSKLTRGYLNNCQNKILSRSTEHCATSVLLSGRCIDKSSTTRYIFPGSISP